MHQIPVLCNLCDNLLGVIGAKVAGRGRYWSEISSRSDAFADLHVGDRAPPSRDSGGVLVGRSLPHAPATIAVTTVTPCTTSPSAIAAKRHANDPPTRS